MRWGRWQDHASAAPETRTRVERVLSTGRIVLAAASLAAVYIEFSEAGPTWTYTRHLVIAYAAFAAGVFILVRLAPRFLQGTGVVIHAIDVLWAGAVAFLARGSNSPFLLLLVFVVFAAAARWGPTATLVTGALAIAAFVTEVLLTPALAAGEPGGRPGSLVTETTYVVALTLVAGFLATHGRAYLAERDALSRVLAGIGAASSFADALRLYVDECLARAGSSRALIAVEALGARRFHLWRVTRPKGGSSTRPVLQDLTAEEGQLFFSPPPAGMTVWHVERRDTGRLVARGLGPGSFRTARADGSSAGPLLQRHHASSLLVVEAQAGEDWRARLILLDPDAVSRDDLEFQRLLVSRAGPALYTSQRVGRMRSRVSVAERARFARELHDHTLQSLIGLEMEIEVLRRHAQRVPLPESRVRQIRDQLRLAIADARDLMLRLKPAAMTGTDVLRVIAELAGRLRREGGLDVRVVSSCANLDCAPRTCRHLARIVQEALTNVRKHSGARAVTITVSENDRTGRLVIEDDGRGFAFSGRLTLEQLEATDIGPALIKERVRAMSGRLTIASRPGAGAGIEVEWPRVSHG